MRRGTTPTIPLTIDKDISDGWTIYATFRSGSHEVELTNDRMTIELEPETETEQAKRLMGAGFKSLQESKRLMDAGCS